MSADLQLRVGRWKFAIGLIEIFFGYLLNQDLLDQDFYQLFSFKVPYLLHKGSLLSSRVRVFVAHPDASFVIFGKAERIGACKMVFIFIVYNNEQK